MKSFIKAAACLAVLASATAHADMFEFSYTFSDGGHITGSLDGTLVAGQVQNISDLQVAFNGVDFSGPLSATGWDAATQSNDLPAVVSVNAAQNNFIFSDSATTNLFSMVASNDAFNGVNAFNSAVVQNNSDFDPTANASWSLQPVPLPGAFLLLSSGLGLLGAVRRRRAADSMEGLS